MQNESAESVEIFKHWTFFVFLFWNLKYDKWLVLNVRGRRDHKFLTSTWTWNRVVLTFVTYLRVPSLLNKNKAVFISSCINWLNWFSFWQILHITKSVSTLRIGKSAFCMLIIRSILKFLPIRRIHSAERIRGVSRSF